jgi:mannosyltransferase OCH1-like enzyme
MGRFNETGWLHQIIIVDGFQRPDNLPVDICQNSRDARRLYLNAKYKLWCGEELRDLIRDNFSREVLRAFDSLRPYSYKADLARLCLLHLFGGLYFDLAIQLTNVWDVPEHCGIAAFSPAPSEAVSWTAIQTDLLWSRPKRPEWSIAIERIIENCQTRFYGPNDQFPTGSPVLGRAFASAMISKGQTPEADDQWVGEVRIISEGTYQNRAYVAPDRLLVGLSTKVLGGPGHFGLAINDYEQLFKQGKVYFAGE